MTSYEQYREHMRKYASETGMMSCTQSHHPAFQAMLSMGTEVVPHMVLDLHDYLHTDNRHSLFIGEFDPWVTMVLLGQIVGADRPIVPEEARGRIDPLCKIWVEWGKRHGYIFSPTSV